MNRRCTLVHLPAPELMRVGEEELPEAQNLELSSPRFWDVVAWESRKMNESPRVVGMCHMFVVEDIGHS